MTLAFGLVGVTLRYFSTELIKSEVFPVSTFLVNLFGCFIAGWAVTTPSFSFNTKTALVMGFCGGLTTFSALMLQSLQMIRAGDWLKAFAYLMVSQVCGLLVAWVGMKFGGQ